MMISSCRLQLLLVIFPETSSASLYYAHQNMSLSLTLDMPDTRNKIFSIGGGEYLSYQSIVETIMNNKNIKKRLINLPTPYLRIISVVMDQFTSKFPISIFWLDYLATNRTTALDTLPKEFGIIPARFSYQLDYL